MNAIKELMSLAKYMFSTRPSEIKDLELISMEHFPAEGYIMMWCGKILVRPASYDRYKKLFDKFPAWRIHETHHLHQAQQEKYKNSWCRYYLDYLWEWIKGNPVFNFHNGAYYTVPQEIEAYANENNSEYVVFGNLKKSKYNISKRVRTFRLYRKEWKKYIRTL